jgi:hypothetical protein
VRGDGSEGGWIFACFTTSCGWVGGAPCLVVVVVMMVVWRRGGESSEGHGLDLRCVQQTQGLQPRCHYGQGVLSVRIVCVAPLCFCGERLGRHRPALLFCACMCMVLSGGL